MSEQDRELFPFHWLNLLFWSKNLLSWKFIWGFSRYFQGIFIKYACKVSTDYSFKNLHPLLWLKSEGECYFFETNVDIAQKISPESNSAMLTSSQTVGCCHKSVKLFWKSHLRCNTNISVFFWSFATKALIN